MATKVEILENHSPQIIIPYGVAMDIQEIVDSKEGEVGWIGTVQILAPNTYLIDKITVPLQKANASTTEITPEGLMGIIENEPEFEIARFNYWGHSHGKINSVYPSDQDRTQMKSFATTCTIFVGTIHNRRGDYFGYVVDSEKGLFYTDVEVFIEEHEAIIQIQSEIEEFNKRMEVELNALEKKKEDLINLNAKRALSRNWKALVEERVTHFNVNVQTKGYNGYQVPTNLVGTNRRWDYATGNWICDTEPSYGGNTRSYVEKHGDIVKALPEAKGGNRKSKRRNQKQPKDIFDFEEEMELRIELNINKEGLVCLKGEIISPSEWSEWGKEYERLTHSLDNNIIW